MCARQSGLVGRSQILEPTAQMQEANPAVPLPMAQGVMWLFWAQVLVLKSGSGTHVYHIGP